MSQLLRGAHSTAACAGPAIEGGEPAADKVVTLYCTILVERESQKPIVIGKGGAMIKQIGTASRMELERFFGARVLDEMGLQGRDRS